LQDFVIGGDYNLSCSQSRPRVFLILIAIVLALGIGGFLARDALFFTFVYTGSSADWELMQIRRQVTSGQVK